MKQLGWHWVAAIGVAIVCMPVDLEADIATRDLGVDGAGQKVTGYVYQAGSGRSSSSISRRSRLGPRVSSGTRHFNGAFVTFGGGVNRAPVIVAPRSILYVPYRVRFCRTAGHGLAPLGFRAVNASGRFSFKLGF
jgi:hypothetical protein